MANDILYDLTPWEDAPSMLTPINAENLNARDSLLKKVVDKTNQLSEQIGNQSGLTNDLKTAFINYYTHVMPNFDDTNGLSYVNAILTALGAETRGESGGEEEPDTPDNPEVTLTSISAIYTGGEVATGTDLSALTGITVTGTYSDGTTKTVTGYTLSGEILEGENTITVSYGGKTTTFTVTGIVESGGGDTTAELPTGGLISFWDFRNATYETKDWNQSISPTVVGEKTLYYNIAGTNAVTTDEKGMDKAGYIWDNSSGYGNTLKNIPSVGIPCTFVSSGYGAFALYGYVQSTIYNLCTVIGAYMTADSLANDTLTKTTSITLNNSNADRDYHTFAFVIDTNILKIYFDGEVVLEENGTDYSDFEQWLDRFRTILVGDRGTAIGIYNRAFSEVEVVEMHAYLKTLEVA